MSVVVSATSEDMWASASGTVSVPAAAKVYRLKAIRNRFVASGTKATLKLKVPTPEGDQASATRQEEGQGEHQAHRPRQHGNLTARKRTVKLKR